MEEENKNWEKALDKIAHDYSSSGVPIEQLILAAQEGLTSAFKLSRENSKWSFAEHWDWHVRQSVLKFIADREENE